MSERSNPLRNFLCRLRWDESLNPEEYLIIFVSRGAPGDVEAVRGSSVERVYLRGFEVREGDKVKYIPFHRIVEIRNSATGKVVYEKGVKKERFEL